MAKDNQYRLSSPLMEKYRELFSQSQQWKGTDSLTNKRVVVYCEQGFGDIIQFARYFKHLKDDLDAYIILYAHSELRRLLQHLADEFIDKELCEKLPDHDYHVLSMSLPFILGEHGTLLMSAPYINVPDVNNVEGYESCFKIGIAWEGNPTHSNNLDRCCPLEYFAQLAEIPNTQLFILQNRIHNHKLLKNCDNLDICGAELNDFWDTAALINAMDIVITVDTSVLHLAGAMGKQTYGLLSFRHDPRWGVQNWYPSVKLITQKRAGDWDSVFDELFKQLNAPIQRNKLSPELDDGVVLFTGGIGDVLALECFMPEQQKQRIHTIYYATRAAKSLIELFKSSGVFPALKRQICLWEDFSEFFAIYTKAECSYILDNPPEDWAETSDWSMVPKFQEIELGYYEYNYSGFLVNRLAIIDQHLPKNYIVIAPVSGNDPRRPNRNFNEEDWKGTLEYLNQCDMKGVVLGSDECSVPNDEKLINLNRKTDLIVSFEILKLAKGYIGVDSCLSVLASKLFDEHLFVKSTDKHLLRWKHVYYAPKKDFSFIGSVVNMVTSCPQCT
jgi:ADP-heptose:LPS heptosyltransferase